MDSNLKLIFSMKLAGYLMQRGFVLLDMRKNTDQSNRNVFIFNESAELRNAIDDYSREKNN